MNRLTRISTLFVFPMAALMAQTGGVGDPSTEPGTPPSSYALSGLDSINFYNGHLNVSLPVRSMGLGRGSAIRTAVAGIDRVWSATALETGTVPSSDIQPPYASIYALGSLTAAFHPGVSYACPTVDENGIVQYRNLGPFTTTISWYTGNGTRTELLDVALNGQQQGANITDCSQLDTYQPANRGRVFRSTDGSDVVFVADADVIDGQANGPIAGKLILRDGTKFTFGFDSYVTQVEDRNGNLLQFSFSSTATGGIFTVTDALGRTETINFTECLNGCQTAPDTQDIFDHPGASGARRQRIVNYAQLSNVLSDGESLQTYKALFPELAGSSTDSYNPFVISSVALPDGTSYSMQYNAYGELTRMRLPTGGVFTYCYAEAYRATACAPTAASGVITLADGTFKILRRVLERDEYSDGTTLSARTTLQWTGSDTGLDAQHGARPGTVAQVDTLSPGGSVLRREKHFFYGNPASTQPPPADGSKYAEWWLGLEFRSETGNDSATLQTKQMVYGQRPCPSNEACGYEPQADNAPAHDPQMCQVNTTLDDGTTSAVLMTYDQQNNVTDKYEYGFGAGPDIGASCQAAPAGWKRRTNSIYRTDASYLDPSVHLVSLPSETHVYDGETQQPVAYTLWNYDELNTHPLQDAPGILGHDAAYGTGYVARGNLTGFLRSENGSTLSILETRDYDIAGNVVLYKDGNRHGTTFEYNGDSANVYAFATKTTDALGHAATAAYDYGIGRAAWLGDFNNTYTFFDRSASDGLDRVTGTRVVSGGSTLRQSAFSYPDPNTVITKSDLNTAGDLAMQAVTLYDGLGRVTAGRSYESASGYIETTTGYDALGRVVSQTDPSRTGPGAATTSAYDALGRVLGVTHQDGTVATNAYSGYATTSTDESGAAKRVVYDWAGRIATVFEDPAGLRYGTNYQYDALDNLKLVSQGYCPACQGRAFSYDGLSRLKSANNAESGITSYLYDAAGNVTSRTDARNITTTYSYDALNRPTAKSASDGSLNLTWSYDSGTYGLGRLSAVTSSAGTTSYAYDAQGRVTGSTQETAGQAYPFSYGYNAAGSLTSETYPSGRVATQTYDVLDRVTAVTGSKNAVTTNYGVVLGYAAHGAVQAMRYGNAVETDLEYDAQLRQNANIAQTNNNLYLYAIHYQTWAGNGNLAGSEAYEGGYGQFLSLSHFTQSYSYDKVNRLTGVTDSGGYYSRSYGYDQYRNLSVTANSGVPYSGLTPYSGDGSNPFGAGNRLNAGGYDAAGNQTTLGSLQLGYDADNRQVLAQDGSNVAGYSYDGNGRRVLQGGPAIGTTVYVYDAFNRLAAEYFDAAAAAAPCQTCYLSTDYLGSVRLVTNETGATVGLHDYLPFGEEIPGNTAGRDGTFGGFERVRQRFTGQERDETNLDFFQARYSAATLGRFLSPDPANAGVDLLNPQS